MSIVVSNRKPNRLGIKLVIFCAVIGTAFYLYSVRLTRTVELVRAVQRNDTTVALRLLAAGADPNRRAPFSDEEGGTHDILTGNTEHNPKQGPPLLLTAAEAGNAVVVHALLARGANPNARDSFNTTPLIGAARSGNVGVANALLPRGADINAADRNGRTALSFAARYHHVEVASLLISHGAQINIHTKTGDTPLTDAAKSGNPAVVETLVRAGADIDAHNRDGQTALLLAARGNNTAIVRLLLEHGADPNLAAKTGETPLQCAARFRNAAVISLLLQRKADPNRANRDGETALMLLFALQNPQGVAVITVPVRRIGSPSPWGVRSMPQLVTPYATTPGQAKHLRFCINLLLAHGANLNYSVLTQAATNADVTTFAMLLRTGAHGNPTGKEAADLICAAGLAQTPDNLNLLLSRFAHMDLKVDPRSTIYATYGVVTHPRVLKWLLDHGADADAHYAIADAHYVPYSALLTAVEAGEAESVKLLLNHGAKVDAKYADNAALAQLVPPSSSIKQQNRARILTMLQTSIAHAHRDPNTRQEQRSRK